MINRVDSEAAVRPFEREVLQRLPLADAVLSLWAFVMDPTEAIGRSTVCMCGARDCSVPMRKLWWKTTNKRHRKKTPTQKNNGAHTSVAKLLAAAAGIK